MAAIYGAEIGLDLGAMIGSNLPVQFIGIPCTFLFGSFADVLGVRRPLFTGLVMYVGISELGYVMQSATQFLILAVLIGTVQGGTQALSRSLFASLTPKQRSVEFFSLFALSEKLAGMLGPSLFAATSLTTGSSRLAIISVVDLFSRRGDALEQGRHRRRPSGRPRGRVGPRRSSRSSSSARPAWRLTCRYLATSDSTHYCRAPPFPLFHFQLPPD